LFVTNTGRAGLNNMRAKGARVLWVGVLGVTAVIGVVAAVTWHNARHQGKVEMVFRERLLP